MPAMLARRAVLLTSPTAEPCLPTVYPEQRRATPLESTLIGMLQVFILNNLKLFRINTYEKRGGKGRKGAHFAQFWCNVSPFRMNTSKSVSKQRTLTTFRMNTYEKQGEGGRSTQLVIICLGLRLGALAPPPATMDVASKSSVCS